jgi:hypothetical protein
MCIVYSVAQRVRERKGGECGQVTLSHLLHLEAALISPRFVGIEVYELAEGYCYVDVVCPFDDSPVS